VQQAGKNHAQERCEEKENYQIVGETGAVQECLDWLERNQMAETEEFENQQKELERLVNPIMMKVYTRAS
jgi:hypothetical protein